MAVTGSLQLSLEFGICRNHNHFHNFNSRPTLSLLKPNSSSIPLQHYSLSCNYSKRINRRVCTIPRKSKTNHWRCHCFLNPSPSFDASSVKNVALIIERSFNRLQGNPVVVKLASAVGIVAFALWGLGPLLRQSRNIFLHKNDSSWKKSSTYLVATSYVRPLLLWTGAIIVCRAFDTAILPTEAGQIVKQRLLNFVRSLSTVLAFAYCLSSVIQQAQKFVLETNDPTNTRNMGFQFAGKAVYTAVWVAAVSLFMELLGFSTQKWLTAGGLGTVLLTLAGREIFTNFLSSAMIHATRPFVVNEWIQTKIEGYDVSGTVEHVGWWSPTIIRGEDREAVHIPNHKFTVNVVRNLTQKTHWRIKTHLAISHLDVSKINIIVADMRKVLAKNPQVEQQKLHRRVFLDNINPENQALLILVSCFVKTSHFEEYLCVKEAILLDLLRVIRHHRARLATPIRTVQKIYSDGDLDNVPFSDSIFNRGTTSNRPLLLIEPSYKINGDEKSKPQARSLRVNGEEDGKTSAGATKSSSNAKVDAKGETSSSSNSATSADHKSKDLSIDSKADNAEVQTEDPKVSAKSSDQKLNNSTTSGSNIVEETSVQAEDLKVSAKSSDQKLNNSTKPGSKIVEETSSSSEASSGPARNTSINKKPQKLKQEETRQAVAQPSVSKASLEENIVLGVALEGSKRTLPIEEEVVNAPEDVKELAAMRSGSDKDKNDTKRPKNPPVDQPEQQLD